MTEKMNFKVRKVRCARCLRLLLEPPDVSVYECGGCGAKLQAKKRNNSTVDTTLQKPDDDSSGEQKVEQVFDDQEAGSSSNQQSLLNSTNESDQNSDHNGLHSSNKDQDAAKRAENGTFNASPSVVEEYSSEKLKMKQLSDNHTSNEQDQAIHNDPRSSTEFSGNVDPESSPNATALNRIDQEENQKLGQIHYQDAGKKQENLTLVKLEHSSGKQKIERLSDDNETGSSLTQLLLVNSLDKLDHNNDCKAHRSSSELAYHDDKESSLEATVHDRVNRHETEFVSSRKEKDIYESSSEFEETVANTRIINDSDGGSSFRSMIAERLLETRQKKAAYPYEDDLLSEDGSANLHHRRRFDRISSVETMETTRVGGASYYGYEGSVSSFDGNDDQNLRKNHTSSMHDEHADSRNRYRFNWSTDVSSFYGLNEFHENSRDHSFMIHENPELERIKLLKLVRELQDQLERTNMSNLQQVPSYYNHVGRYGQRMAFSGEAMAVNRRQDGGSCHHCCPQPQNRHFSAQIPRHHVCCNTFHSPRFSGASSPKRNHSITESDFSVSYEHWQRNDVRKPYRSPKKKRYVRPIAGGSPLITCYLCSKLLQLPQSFLLFNKRHHSLRCGGCLKVLSFTLSKGTHVSRYYPEETLAAPLSNEVGDFNKLTESLAGPVSCSDSSFEKSCSTETDRNGSQGFSEERRKATMSRHPLGSTRPPSSKVSGRGTTTSEIEEAEPGLNGSPLHWLMGYASPSKVTRG